MTGRTMTIFAATGLIVIGGLSGPAARADLAQRYSFRIDPQSLSSALIEFSKQADVQVVGNAQTFGSLETAGVSGEHTGREALQLLLNRLPIVFEEVTGRSVRILPKKGQETAQAAASPPLVYAAAGGAGTQTVADETLQEVQVSIPEILIRGKKSLNTDIKRDRDAARPYVVFGREALERSGAQNLEDFFRKNLASAVSGAVPNSQVSSIVGSASQIDLGGLGTDETLILVDGRRMAGFFVNSNPNQPDINGIPLSAIERIEVLRSTASGIYGGAATGGVINIVMRRDYTGTEAKLTYENTLDGGAMRKRVDLTGGYSFGGGKTNLLVSGSYSDMSPLLARDRDLVQRGRALILQNDPNTFYGSAFSIPLGATTNIVSSAGAPLTLKTAFGGGAIGATRTFVPLGYAGPASDQGAALRANAGLFDLNLADTTQASGGRKSLMSDPTLKSLTATLRQEITQRLSAFLEGAASENRGQFQISAAPISFSLQPGDAGNPFNQAITVAVPMSGVDQTRQTALRSVRAAGGLTAKISARWLANLDYTWNRSTVKNYATDFFDSAAATSRIAAGTLNVFRDLSAFSADFSPVFYPGLIAGYTTDTTLRDAALRLSGPLPLTLPGGATTLSGSLEYRKEIVGDFIQTSTALSPTSFFRLLFPQQSQTVKSVYIEALLPIFTSTPFADMLELQVAARHDRYRTQGASRATLDSNLQPLTPVVRRENELDSTDPALALRYKPVKDLMFRASYGTGFLPPAVNQIVPNAQPTPVPGSTFASLGIVDPARNNEPLGAAGPVAVLLGGNPDLRPEESKSTSAGIVLTPRMAPNLRLSLDWTRIEKSDAIVAIPIATAGLVTLLTEAAPERITRAASSTGAGAITALNLTSFNFSSSETQAYDLALDYTWPSARFGNFSLSSSVTKLASSKSRLTPLSSEVENAGVLNTLFGNLRWKAFSTLKWDYRSWTVAWTTRYYDSYYLNTAHTPVAAQRSAAVPSQTYHDLFVGYTPRLGGFFANTVLQGGVTNLFNKAPPFDAQSSSQAFYSSVGDPRLTTYYLSLRKSFD